MAATILFNGAMAAPHLFIFLVQKLLRVSPRVEAWMNSQLTLVIWP
jgi:hypothetical protein